MDWEDGGMYEVPVPHDVNDYHILVIDEDEAFSKSVASILREASYQVSQIQIPEVALSMIQQQPKLFDLVLVGIPLQATDPITFLKNILALNHDMPVLLMCSRPDLSFILTALQYGATLVLDKPIKRYTLRSLWQHVVRKRSIAAKKKQRKNVGTGSSLANVSLHPSKSSVVDDIWKGISCYENLGKSTITPNGKWQECVFRRDEISKTSIAMGKRKLERDEQVMRLPFALGFNSAAFFWSSMDGNTTLFPRVNVSSLTPALPLTTVSLTAGVQNHNQGPRDVASSVNRELVNVVADEESSSNDREEMIRDDYEFTLEELFPEHKNGDDASTSTDDKQYSS